MVRRMVAAWGLAAMLTASAMGQEAQSPATAPASAPATVQVDASTLEALKQRLRDQERRIQQLEAAKDNGEQVRREEVVQILKEMNLANDKRPEDFRVYWKDGLRFDTNDGNFKLKLGGRLHVDTGYIKESSELADALGSEPRNGTEIRRARILLAGEIYKDIEFVWEYDFAGGSAAIKDAYIGMKNIPIIGNVRVGNFKEPFSLDELTSDNYVTFMERALPNCFAPSYRMGVMAFNSFLADSNKTDRMTWALGAFRNSTNGSDYSDDGNSVTGRITALPWYEDKGNRLLHIGAAYSYRTPNDDGTLRYRSKPEANFVRQYFVDTGNMQVNNNSLFGGEVATVVGPWHAESEFIASYVDAQDTNSGCFSGFYVQSGYFLTGETRPYKTSTGTFDRLKPKKNFREKGGLGAWEVAARYSYLDLSGDPTTSALAGQLQDITIGLNWYLNPNVRVMWNYIHSMPNLSATDDAADIAMMRFQIDF